MAQALPLILAALAGFALVLVLTALWQSLRLVLQSGTDRQPQAAAGAATKRSMPNARVQAREALLREKGTLLQAIRDVRFEHDLGKVSDGDLERLDAQYRVRARAVLGELDAQLAPYRDKARSLLGISEDGSSVTAVVETKPETKPEAGPKTVACVACSTTNDTDAVFCKKCGARMAGESEVAS